MSNMILKELWNELKRGLGIFAPDLLLREELDLVRTSRKDVSGQDLPTKKPFKGELWSVEQAAKVIICHRCGWRRRC